MSRNFWEINLLYRMRPRLRSPVPHASPLAISRTACVLACDLPYRTRPRLRSLASATETDAVQYATETDAVQCATGTDAVRIIYGRSQG
jgi:hypothetical protein